MKKQDHFYDIYPKVLKVGATTTITIRPLYEHVAFKEDHEYSFTYAERDTYKKNPIEAKFENGIATIQVTPQTEQEFTLLLIDSWNNKERSTKTEFCFYAVEEDIFDLRPWKGDFHLHSCRSDGQESPVYVAANYRKEGFDFFALTDHRRYEPSIEVVEAFKQLDTNFKVFPGEEVHPPRNIVHQVNFGGAFSVNKLHENTEQYEKEVQEIIDELDLSHLDEHDKYCYASSRWCFDKIREGGGISLFCHPYWIWDDHFNVSEKLIQTFFDRREFDAFELIGGFYVTQAEANSLQVARWNEERAKGNDIPVVGVSDSHGTQNAALFNWYYTLVFAPTTDFADLKDAILNKRSVAVHNIANESPQLHGQFRFVKYAYFCLREILPLHHAECQEEGRQMLKFFAGDKNAANFVALCKNRVEDLYKKLW